MATKKKPDTLTDTQKIGLGIGLTAAAVAAAGTYFLYGSKNAGKNRKTVKSWALKAKAEVLEKIEGAKEMSREEYEQLIDSVSGAYAGLKQASKVDIATFKKEMKEYWKDIERSAAPKKTAVKKAITKATKAAKKSAAKSTKQAKKTAKKAAK